MLLYTYKRIKSVPKANLILIPLFPQPPHWLSVARGCGNSRPAQFLIVTWSCKGSLVLWAIFLSTRSPVSAPKGQRTMSAFPSTHQICEEPRPAESHRVTMAKKSSCLEQAFFMTFKKMSEVQGSLALDGCSESRQASNRSDSLSTAEHVSISLKH